MNGTAYLITGACLFIVLLAAFCLVRYLVLSKRSGCVEAALDYSKTGSSKNHWRAGLVIFSQGNLQWWRATSLAVKPKFVWSRRKIDIVETQDVVEINHERCRIAKLSYEGKTYYLTMREDAYQGLAAWIESVPPQPCDLTA